jgi:hypothetical protein
MSLRLQIGTGRRRGIVLALFALVLQLATSIAHHHPDRTTTHGCVTSQDQRAHAGCADPRGHRTSERACGVCALLALARNGLEPQAIAVPQPVAWLLTSLETLSVPALRGTTVLVIRTRGPPRLAII